MMLWAVGTFGSITGFVSTKVDNRPVLEVMQPSNDQKTCSFLNWLIIYCGPHLHLARNELTLS